MMTLKDYQKYIQASSGIAQCACWVDDSYYNWHKDEKYVVVLTSGFRITVDNELRKEPLVKYIGTLEELNTTFKVVTKGTKSRTPRTLFNKIITNRRDNECVLMRQLVPELDS